MSKKHKYSVRVFQCPECNNKMYAPKGRGHCSSKGHIKTMFSPYYKCERDFIQIDIKQVRSLRSHLSLCMNRYCVYRQEVGHD